MRPTTFRTLFNWTNTARNETYAGINCNRSVIVRVFLSGILVILILCALIGNVSLCIVVYRRPGMRSGINLLLANVALSDFANSVLNLPLSVVLFNLRYWPLGKTFCGVNVVMCFVMNVEKATILTIISIDRYFIIVKRKDTITPSKANLFIYTSWLVALVLSMLPIFGWGDFKYRCGYIQCIMDFESKSNHVARYLIFLSSLTIFLPALMLIIIYSRIFRTIQRNSFRVASYASAMSNAIHITGSDYGYKRRTSATILILCVTLMACLLPIGFMNIYVSVNGFTSAATRDTYFAFLWISHIHSAFNPIIYYCRIKKFREILHDTWPHLFTRLFIHRSERRITPYVTYQVGKNGVIIN